MNKDKNGIDRQEDQLYSMKDIARRLNVSLSYVKQTIRWELTDPIILGPKCLRWRNSQIEAFLKNRENKN